MILATSFAYFLLVSIGVVLFVFPGYRSRVVTTLWLVISNGWAPLANLAQRFGRFLQLMYSGGEHRLGGYGRFIAAHPLLVGSALLMIVAPSLLAVLLRGPAVFDFADDAGITDRQIAVLLEGEQLVPPPPLPPDVFTTREVEQVRPDVVHASRNWNLMDQEFTQRLLVVFKLMKERHGYEMVLIEGYRSPERQAKLLEQGGHVTQVGANMSYHQHGLAADSAFFRDGKVVISERDPWAMRGYELYGQVAEQVGLTWGGRWKMQDYGHVELRRKGVLGRPAQ
ncbi:M15 family metallopeptidase [Dechloromonas denitrificans]|uniref:M15 family metallopeptidase n=1 Tax=Dechloromonas denitrificans TaxID=281362 RepID=UPI001CF84A6F|nr:M15 family metallopeptidase [Dechloromonas denitrificans]UCV02016.1 M15 family metallopeptidase [Dechloromonas denitrificans]